MKTISYGFSLLELLLVILIIGILASFTAGGIINLVSGSSASTAVESTMIGFYSAKSEALKRRTNVTVCALKEGTQDECGVDANDWIHGYLIFIDNPGGEPNGVVNNGDEILSVNQQFSSVDVNASNSWFSYNAEGRSQAGTIRFCNKENVGNSKLLNMSLLGVPKVDNSTGECS